MKKYFKDISEASDELKKLGFLINKFRTSNIGNKYFLFLNEETCDYILLYQDSGLSVSQRLEIKDKYFLLEAIKFDNRDHKVFSPSLNDFLDVVEVLERKQHLEQELIIKTINQIKINKI